MNQKALLDHKYIQAYILNPKHGTFKTRKRKRKRKVNKRNIHYKYTSGTKYNTTSKQIRCKIGKQFTFYRAYFCKNIYKCLYTHASHVSLDSNIYFCNTVIQIN